MTWQILICTLKEREKKFKKLFDKLNFLIQCEKLELEIEILFYKDDRKQSVGYKRNWLLEKSIAKYVCFIDDDDDISDNYIRENWNAILKDKDCVELVGIYHDVNSGRKKKFIHSILTKNMFELKDAFHRPPNHLNIIKRELAIQIKFPEKNHGEDADWCMEMSKSGLLNSQVFLNIPLYYYNFNSKTSSTLGR